MDASTTARKPLAVLRCKALVHRTGQVEQGTLRVHQAGQPNSFAYLTGRGMVVLTSGQYTVSVSK